MTPWHPALQRHWHAVARADRLGRKPMAVTLMDQPIVLARLGDGRLLALEDRCPHRQVALSEGCIVGDGLRCAYHGWRFGADGALQDLPGLPPEQLPPAVRVPAHAVLEHDGLVWLRPGAGGEAAPSRLVRALVPAQRRFLWQTEWAAHVVDAMENFLDPLHTHLLHPGLVRRGGPAARVRVALAGTDEGFVVDYRGQPQQSGWLYRLFESPRTHERAHFAAPGSAQIEYGYARGGSVRISLHFSPVTANRTSVFASLHVDGRWSPAWAVRWFVLPFLHRVGEQDRRMLQKLSDNQARFPGRRNASTPLDLVRPLLEQFWEGGALPGPDAARELDMLL